MLPISLELPSNYLDEETRCNFVITNQMKKVWAVELDLLSELLRICKKYNIKIFASGGTLLGAIRHKGFIPWDDDIDMLLYREDYNKLCAIADNEFKHPYFFQTEYNDKSSLRGHAQLRNSLTTGILKRNYSHNYKFNQGIFIDIFPHDAVIDTPGLLAKQSRKVAKLRKKYFRLANLTDRYEDKSSNSIKLFIKRCAHYAFTHNLRNLADYDKFYRQMELECQKYNNINTEFISSLSFKFDSNRLKKKRSDYQYTIDMPFEFLTIPVCNGYLNALDLEYGNWHEFKMGKSNHKGIIFDTEKPYTYYINKNMDEK